MSDPTPKPHGLRPHRIARTDQQLATANGRLDKLLAEYRAADAEEGATSAALATSLAMRLKFEHIDVAMIAVAAIQRLDAAAAADDDSEGTTG